MNNLLRISIADDEPRMRDYLGQILQRLGHEVLSAAASGRELIDQALAMHPDLVITDIKMPDMDGIDAAAEIYRHEAIPVILVSAFYDPELIQRASRNHILAYLVKPIKDVDLAPAISIAMQRFGEFQSLRDQAADLKQALEDRKVIERAKGILMKRAGLDEQDAFRRLQKLASGKNRKLIDIAHVIVTAEEALQSADS